MRANLSRSFPGRPLKGWQTFIFTALFIALTGTSCKNKNASEELEREQRKADSLMRVAAEKQRRLETEEELAERMRLLKNKGFKGNDSVYYAAQVSARPDSLLSVITLKGKANRSGKINTFDHTGAALDGQIARGIMRGAFFRSDRIGENTFRLYSFEEESGNVFAYRLAPLENTLELTPTRPAGNYRYDLLKQRSFKHALKNEKRFFTTIKSARITDDPELDSLFNNVKIYRDSENLLPESISPSFSRLWLHGEHGSSNVLLSHPTDSTIQTITLSGRYLNPKTEVNISSKFLNDSIWQQATVRETLVYDHPHLVVFEKDSLIRRFQYDENFNFRLTATDTLRSKKYYPQYYPELKDSLFEIRSQDFVINGNKVYWRYLLNYSGKTKGNDVRVRVNNKDLVDASSGNLIFRLPRAGTPSTAGLPELLTPPSLFEGTDLNFDGAADLSFRKGSDVNNNPIYIVYLYEPATGRFKRTPELDGRSVVNGIIRDTVNKKLLYTGYIDGGHMSVSVITPDPSKVTTREIYWTTGDKSAPTVHYQKLVNNRITDKQSPLADNLALNGADLSDALVNWILNR